MTVINRLFLFFFFIARANKYSSFLVWCCVLPHEHLGYILPLRLLLNLNVKLYSNWKDQRPQFKFLHKSFIWLKSSLVYTWTFKCREKNEECPHLLQDKLLILSHWYSMESYFHLRQLASFELKIWIFDFYQSRGNKTFLDVLWNITFTFTEKNVIEQPFFKHFQTLASFSCKAQGNFSVPLKYLLHELQRYRQH